MTIEKLRHTKEGNISPVEFFKINPNTSIPKVSFGNKTKTSIGIQKKDEFVKSKEQEKLETQSDNKQKEISPRAKKLFKQIEIGMKEKGLEKYTKGVIAFFEIASEDDLEYLESGNNLQDFLDNDLNDINTIKLMCELCESPMWGKISYDSICSLSDLNAEEISVNEFLEGATPEEVDNTVNYVKLSGVKKGERLKEYARRLNIFRENIENLEDVPKNAVREIIGNKELDEDFLLEVAKVINKKNKQGKIVFNDNYSKIKAEHKGIMLEYIKHRVPVQERGSGDYFHSFGLDELETLCSYSNKDNVEIIEKMLSNKDISIYEIQSAIKEIKPSEKETILKNMEMFERFGLKSTDAIRYEGEEITDREVLEENKKEFLKMFKYSYPPHDVIAAVCLSKNNLEYAKLMNKYSVGPSTISAALQNNKGTDDVETIKKRLDEILNHKDYKNENFAWIPYGIKNEKSFEAFKTFEEILIGQKKDDFEYFKSDDRKIFALEYDDPKKVKERMQKISNGYARLPFAIMATSDEMFELSKKAEEKFDCKELSNTIFSYEQTKGKKEFAEKLYKKAELLFDEYEIAPDKISELIKKGNYEFGLNMLRAGIDKNFIEHVDRLKSARRFDEEKTIKALANYQKYGDLNDKSFCKFLFDGYDSIDTLLDEKRAECISELIKNGYEYNEISVFLRSAETAHRAHDKDIVEDIKEKLESANKLKSELRNLGYKVENESIARHVAGSSRHSDEYIGILTGATKFSPKMSLKEKIDIYQSVKKIEIDETAPMAEKGKLHLKKIISEIEASLTNTEKFVEVDFNAQNEMFQNTIKNSSKIENALANFDFTKYKKEGLPLSYSRKEFLEDLNIITSEMTEDEITEITKKLGIDLIHNPDGEITGYNGIIKFHEVKAESEAEEAILEIANNFIMENKIQTGDEIVDKALNSLIKGMPEFVNTIGKQQHGTQAYSVDIHTMKVLTECLNNEKFKELSNLDKTKLKLCVLTHDIAKSEGVVDKGHQEYSAIYAKSILDKYAIPANLKDKVFELVKNHHWLEAYNTGAKKPEELAVSFRFYDDYSISKIIAEADLKGVNDEFYGYYGSALSDEAQKPLTDAISKLNKKGNFLYVSDSKIQPAYESRVSIVEHNGKNYKCINFTEIQNDEDLSKYGFMPNTKKEDIRFQTHMARKAENLETIMSLQEISNDSVLSTSYTSLTNNKTYYGTKFGVILDNEVENIANATKENQGSGYGKGWSNFVQLKTSENNNTLLLSELQEILGINEEEYEELYKQFSGKKYISAIRNTKEFTAGDKKFSGEKLADAILEAQDKLLETGESHNEVVAYNTKVRGFIAKVESIDEIPEEFLNFVEKYDLTIYIVGNG